MNNAPYIFSRISCKAKRRVSELEKSFYLNQIIILFLEILSKDVRHVSVPHYDNLTLDKMKAFCLSRKKDIDTYLPDKREIHKVSREFICNVYATVLKNIFTDWVKQQIDERNEEMKEKKDMNILMDSDIAAAFQASSSVSCKKIQITL